MTHACYLQHNFIKVFTTSLYIESMKDFFSFFKLQKIKLFNLSPTMNLLNSNKYSVDKLIYHLNMKRVSTIKISNEHHKH